MSTIVHQTLVQTTVLVLMGLENLNAPVGLVTQVGKPKFNDTHYIKSQGISTVFFLLFNVCL